MESATDLFGKYRIVVRKGISERGELLAYFSRKLGWVIPRVAAKVEGLSVEDLYYIKSASDTYEREGTGPWAKAFNGMLKVRS